MAKAQVAPDVKKGSAELLVLALVEERARHGYEIGKLIELRSGGVLKFHIASLYPMLYRLEPLPFPDPSRLVMVWETDADDPSRTFIVAAPNFEDWQKQGASFSSMAIWEDVRFNVAALAGSLPAAIRLAPFRDAGPAPLDPAVLAFTCAIAGAAGVLFSLAPIVGLSRTTSGSSLKNAGDRGSTAVFTTARSALVAVEVALALVVLAAAGLMIKSMPAHRSRAPNRRPPQCC